MPFPAVEEEMRTTCRLIAPHRLGYTQLYLDFVQGQSPAVDFYPAKSAASVAARLDATSYDRVALTGILRRQNAVYGASSATFDNIARLEDPRAVCLFAGQQAGLFGGPLLTIIKALGVIKSARRYSLELDRPVVPVFWIAGDDHDFDEANHTFVPDRDGEPARLAYETHPDLAMPTGDIKLDDPAELTRVKECLKECLGQTDFTDDLYDLIDHAYTTEDTLVTAFGKVMAALTEDLGLVLFSPADSEAKRLAVPFFLKALDLQDGLHETLTATNREIEAAGYHIQVEKKDEATHLFCNLGGRTPILRQDGNFTVGDRRYTKDQLAALINEQPELFSPDVILRPVFQSYLFPVLSQKGGPSEIAYFAQLNPFFALFNLAAPLHRARPTLTLVEARTAQHMEDMAIDFEEVLGDIEQVVNRVMAKTFPTDLEQDFNSLRETLERQFGKFRAEALDFDPGLKAYAEQTRGKIDYTLKNFEAKVFAAHKKKSQQTRERIYRMNNALYPRHGLQERTLNVFYFVSRYGMGLIPYVLGRLDPETPDHQLLCLSEYRS